MGSNTVAGVVVLVIESLHSKYRITCSVMVGMAFTIGEIFMGILAAYVHDFRQILRILYGPGILTIFYLWFYPESIRWLLITGHTDRAIKQLQQAAAVNQRELSASSIEYIQMQYSNKPTTTSSNNTENANDDDKLSIAQSLQYILKSKKLLLRFFSCCYLWIACCLLYYGFSLISTIIPGGNRYTSFIYMVAIEIPASLLNIPLLKRMRRKRMMFALFLLTAIFTFAATVAPANHSILILLILLVSKAATVCAISTLYVFTAECWPTSIRSTVLNLCSMIGRIGAMLAPLITLMVRKIENFP